jgi:hypothetical protein
MAHGNPSTISSHIYQSALFCLFFIGWSIRYGSYVFTTAIPPKRCQYQLHCWTVRTSLLHFTLPYLTSKSQFTLNKLLSKAMCKEPLISCRTTHGVVVLWWASGILILGECVTVKWLVFQSEIREQDKNWRKVMIYAVIVQMI